MIFCPILFVYNYEIFKKSGTVFSLALMFYARFMEGNNEVKTKQKYQTKQKQNDNKTRHCQYQKTET